MGYLKDFRIMERNLKEFVNSDRTHLPSDGGLIVKICRERNFKRLDFLLNFYYKKIKKILQPVILEYFQQGKDKNFKTQKYFDFDKYFAMSCQDIYDNGIDFHIPITNMIRFHEKDYPISEHLASCIGITLQDLVCKIVPEFNVTWNRDYSFEKGDIPERVNCILPPFPVEFLYLIKESVLADYCKRLDGKERLVKEIYIRDWSYCYDDINWKMVKLQNVSK